MSYGEGRLPKYSFRKVGGEWQRRPIEGGRWRKLRVRSVTPKSQHEDSRPSRMWLKPIKVWSWE